jgi:hypothetical protein
VYLAAVLLRLRIAQVHYAAETLAVAPSAVRWHLQRSPPPAGGVAPSAVRSHLRAGPWFWADLVSVAPALLSAAAPRFAVATPGVQLLRCVRFSRLMNPVGDKVEARPERPPLAPKRRAPRRPRASSTPRRSSAARRPPCSRARRGESQRRGGRSRVAARIGLGQLPAVVPARSGAAGERGHLTRPATLQSRALLRSWGD